VSEAELWAAWRLWMAVAVVIVLVAAGLLLTIWRAARGILAEATRALAAAERIRRQTTVIWELQTTNEVAESLLETVEALEKKGGALAGALESHAPSAGR
jgi:hypothetical protein